VGHSKRVAQISPTKLRLESSLRESEFELKRVLECVCKLNEWPNELTGRGGPFIALKRNLPIEVLETQT
jgi:hypothetical protein